MKSIHQFGRVTGQNVDFSSDTGKETGAKLVCVIITLPYMSQN